MEILYQDNRIAVCLKPPGVLSTDEAGGMPSLLREALRTPCIRTVHRLDRVVGGVMVFACSRKAAAILSEQIRTHQFQKRYLAVVHGTPEAAGCFCDWLLRDGYDGMTRCVPPGTPGSREARLTYRVLAAREVRSLLQIDLQTGRTHQIRAQFSAHGYPLLGDRKYGRGEAGGIALWSQSIGFFHPERGDWMEFSHEPLEMPQFDDFMDCIFRDISV